MDKFKKILLSAITLLAVNANAGVINYDEAVSGDLSFDDFFFDSVGTHTFQGSSFSRQSNGNFSQDGDLFDFNVLAGLEVSAINLSASLDSARNVTDAGVRGSIRIDSQQVYLETIDILGSVSFSQADVSLLPLGNASSLYRAGTGLNLTLQPGFSDYYIEYDWTLEFEVNAVQVSEPGSAGLLALGLFSLLLNRKTKFKG